MLTQPVIADLRGLIGRALAAGIVGVAEIPALARALGALQIEERLILENQQPPAVPPA